MNSWNRPPVVIIGSGFGGAVAAMRLTEAGIPVVLLERGRRWVGTGTVQDGPFSRDYLAPDGRTSWLSDETVLPVGPKFPIDRHIGTLEQVDANNITVFMGAGWGGGSLVYGGVSVIPSKDSWERCFPTEITYEEMVDQWYPKAAEVMGLAPFPADVADHPSYTGMALHRDHAKAAGFEVQDLLSAFDFDVIRRELDPADPLFASATVGATAYGVNSGAKRSLDHTYLERAEATGLLTARTQHEVTAITAGDSTRFKIEANILDTVGDVIATATFETDHLIVCAGSYHTTRMLVEARGSGALPGMNPHVGSGWGTNGNAMVMRDSLTEPTGEMQAAPTAYGLYDPDNAHAPTLLECTWFPLPWECHSLLYLAISELEARGQFSYDPATGTATLWYPEDGNDEAFEALWDIADRLNEVNGGRVQVEPLKEGQDPHARRRGDANSELTEGFFDGVRADFTYHPLGGVNMGSASDLDGRVLGVDGLYVLDGSRLPGTSGPTNPSWTITALAERSIANLLTEDFLPTS